MKLLLLAIVVIVSVDFAQGSRADVSGRFVGRYAMSNDELVFDWGQASLHLHVSCSSSSSFSSAMLQFDLNEAETNGNRYALVYNDNWQMSTVLATRGGRHQYQIELTRSQLCQNTATTTTTTSSASASIVLLRKTEASYGSARLYGVTWNGDSVDIDVKQVSGRRALEFIGDSVLCAFGALGTSPHCQATIDNEDASVSFAALTARALDADAHAEGWSGLGVVRNYGANATTSPNPLPVYLNRSLGVEPTPVWQPSRFVPDAVVIHLGGNDYSTQPSPPAELWLSRYSALLERIVRAYPSASQRLRIFHLCGPMQGDPCKLVELALGELNARHGRAIGHFVDAQHTLSTAQLGCAYHPNVRGHQILANILVPAIASVMHWTT
jgi:lysophospholipase L1-like esterase